MAVPGALRLRAVSCFRDVRSAISIKNSLYVQRAPRPSAQEKQARRLLPRQTLLRGMLSTGFGTGSSYALSAQRLNVPSWSYTTPILAPILPRKRVWGFSNRPWIVSPGEDVHEAYCCLSPIRTECRPWGQVWCQFGSEKPLWLERIPGEEYFI
jgi:hypothetical protein